MEKAGAEKLPEGLKDTAASILLEAARAFYAEPENMRRFEAWKAQQDKQAKQ